MARSPRRRSKSLATGSGRSSRWTKPSSGSNAARIRCWWTLTLKSGQSLRRQISQDSSVAVSTCTQPQSNGVKEARLQGGWVSSHKGPYLKLADDVLYSDRRKSYSDICARNITSDDH